MTFFNYPIYAQFMAGFILLFMFFVFIISLRTFAQRLARKGGIWVAIAKVIFYPLALVFLFCDGLFNIIYMPMLYGERANKYGEGWTVTSRLKYHKRAAMGKRRLNHMMNLNWQEKVSLFLCRKLVDKIDPGHCGG